MDFLEDGGSCLICREFDATGDGRTVLRLSVDQGATFAPARHVEGWSHLAPAEALALLSEIGVELAKGHRATDITVTTQDGHLVVRVAEAPSVIALPNERLLARGGDDHFFSHLIRHIANAMQVDLAVAFALVSGVEILRPHLQDLLDRQGRLRLIVGDYLDVTEPEALHSLMDLNGDVERHVYETAKSSFHPKGWVFRAEDGSGRAIVGSSNLSRTALREGIEWNLATEPNGNGWREVGAAFDDLLKASQVRPLDEAWIESYAERRASSPLSPQAEQIVRSDPPAEVPNPHIIQMEALAGLREIRDNGAIIALVVLATGLGKTWLAAFDSARARRVLFIAHREEILSQATAVFRRLRPNETFGRYDGNSKDTEGSVVFASVATIGRLEHLQRFDPTEFDYVVIDEFHHAAAETYRQILSYFRPQFLLALTATPDRPDEQDVVALCDGNLAYRCDMGRGIAEGLLSPFEYWGVPDKVQYDRIPWRRDHFDEALLTEALSTDARASDVLERYRERAVGPTIGFCSSTRHADFMAEYFRRRGITAVAVHSDKKTSAPRTASILDFEERRIDVLFVVDMFNEGVDIPVVGTVMLLRPTESIIVWLQQVGRGLRIYEGKDRLVVIDWIGNHRSFLKGIAALLGVGDSPATLSIAVDQVRSGTRQLPAGCSVNIDLEVIDLLAGLLKKTEPDQTLEEWFLDFRRKEERRPTAREAFEAGENPRAVGFGGWFGFLDAMGEQVDGDALLVCRGLIRKLSEAKFGDIDTFALLVAALSGVTGLKSVVKMIGSDPDARPNERELDPHRFAQALETIGALAGFEVRDARIGLTGVPKRFTISVRRMIAEVAEWRRAEFRSQLPSEVSDELVLWEAYKKERIAELVGAVFNAQSWNVGVVRVDDRLILLVTIDKRNMAAGTAYADKFLDAQTMSWHSQTRTKMASLIGQMLRRAGTGNTVELFVREKKLGPDNKAAPFVYCGPVAFERWEGESPITVTWRLSEPVPRRLHRAFRIPAEVSA
ncbi:DUF3427 domain-containing protein [Aurantimonas coralicida]|uniref:DUF3427 domain-containing protein n=1 Tax=Aurantimonas coralicida TaxID=182270 RepID=UPI000462D6C8|nr:DUF3427 domain-containing protein [Aurantimonas coralicida]